MSSSSFGLAWPAEIVERWQSGTIDAKCGQDQLEVPTTT